MQDSLKVENIPTHHSKEHNVSGTIQALFFAKFEPPATNLARKDKYIGNFLTTILQKVLETWPDS